MSLPTHKDRTMPTTHLHCPNCGAGFIQPADGPGSGFECWRCQWDIGPTLDRWRLEGLKATNPPNALFSVPAGEELTVSQVNAFITYVENLRKEYPRVPIDLRIMPLLRR
jgi:hypothetical protein